MARRDGAERLEKLDADHDAGRLSDAQWEAERAGVLEDIRRGCDVTMGGRERAGRTVGALVCALGGIALGVAVMAAGAHPAATWVLIILGIAGAWAISHPRAS